MYMKKEETAVSRLASPRCLAQQKIPPSFLFRGEVSVVTSFSLGEGPEYFQRTFD